MSYSGLFKNPDKQILALQWVRKTNSFVRVIFTLLIFLVWIIDLGFPVFCRGLSIKGTGKNQPGKVNVPITIASRVTPML